MYGAGYMMSGGKRIRCLEGGASGVWRAELLMFRGRCIGCLADDESGVWRTMQMSDREWIPAISLPSGWTTSRTAPSTASPSSGRERKSPKTLPSGQTASRTTPSAPQPSSGRERKSPKTLPSGWTVETKSSKISQPQYCRNENYPYICNPIGAWAGRLGTGLQNQLERFNSARHLSKMPLSSLRGIFVSRLSYNFTTSLLSYTIFELQIFTIQKFILYLRNN